MNFRKKLLLFSLQLILSFSLFSQNIVWTGSAGDNAFFNEANWKNTTTNSAPAAGTIDAGIAINANPVPLSVTCVV